MTVRQLFVLSSVVTVSLNAVPCRAQAGPENDASARCKDVRSADFSQIMDAPTQITETKLVQPSDEISGYCQVSGYIAPNVGFTLRMPTYIWNEKFVELGCGGFCGSTDHVSGCDDLLSKGYACIVSDNGHKGGDAKWAYNNLQAEIDHAYRGAHVTALAGKAIFERYCGQTPKKSYFIGGSTGGRQALMEAQRFPWDFDGIIAAVPSLPVPALHMSLLWGNRAITAGTGKPILEQSDLDLLHQAVVARCDMNDGVKDGLIGDPRACAFDPAVLLCTTDKTAGCLTARQMEAVNKIYGGPITSRGEQIYFPGAMKGSERSWLSWFGTIYNFVQENFRYAAFYPDPGPTWKPEDFDFDRDYKRLGLAEGLYTAGNPDLRRFKAAGGKLIAYHGWNDAGGMPLPTVDYYEMVERVLGGRTATQDFFRLFVVPGMNHGANTVDGAFVVDWLNYLEAWVEKGQTPDKVISSHVRLDDLRLDNPDDFRLLMRRLRIPLDPATIEFSRPVYPYPTRTKYLGDGDPKDAASFGPVEP